MATSEIMIDNKITRVTRWTFKIGEDTGKHIHNYDYVVVPQTTGKLHIQTETEKFDAELVSGVSYARTKGVKHNVVNQNDHEFVFVEIELK